MEKKKTKEEIEKEKKLEEEFQKKLAELKKEILLFIKIFKFSWI